MIYIESKEFDPRFNLALEQYVFDEMDCSETYFMLWQNSPSIIIGRNQNAAAEIDSEYVRSRGIPVVRRLSGGGAVYHDLGNLNFTFITDRDEAGGIDFRPFCEPVVKAVGSFGAEAVISGRNDILAEGCKISGNAQYSVGQRVMHHGCILFSTDLTALAGALRPDPNKIRSKGVASVRSRVANLSELLPEGTTLEMFKERLLEFAAAEGELERYELSPQDIARVREIKAQRYDTWEWNWGGPLAYENSSSAYIPGCGSVSVHFSVKKGRITEISLTGDFFGTKDPKELCEELRGVMVNEEELTKKLSGMRVEDYIAGITVPDLVRLLAG